MLFGHVLQPFNTSVLIITVSILFYWILTKKMKLQEWKDSVEMESMEALVPDDVYSMFSIHRLFSICGVSKYCLHCTIGLLYNTYWTILTKTSVSIEIVYSARLFLIKCQKLNAMDEKQSLAMKFSIFNFHIVRFVLKLSVWC